MENGMNFKKIVKMLWLIICMVLFFQISSSTVFAATSTEGVKNLKESTATTESITLKWTKLSGVSGYQVYRSSSKNDGFLKVATIKGSTAVSYKDSELVAGKTYYYKVRSYTKSGSNTRYGAFSNTLTAITKPGKVTGLKFTVSDKSIVKFKWNTVKGASKYKIYYSTSKNGKYKLLGTTTKTSYDYYSNSSDTYYYKVAAVKATKSYEAVGKYSNVIRCSDIWGMANMVASAEYNKKMYGYTTYTVFNASDVYDKVISTVTKKLESNDFLLNDDSDNLLFYCPLDTDITVFENSRKLYDAIFDKKTTVDNYGKYYLAHENNMEKLLKQNYDDFFQKKAVITVFSGTSYKYFKLVQVHFMTSSTGKEYIQAKEKAKSIAASFSGNPYDEVKFAFDYLINNATYDYRERDFIGTNPRAHSAYGALIEQLCVCDGFSAAFYLLMEEYGIPCNIVVNKTHAWNEVMLDGKWYVVDVTNQLFLFGQDIMKSSTDITYSDSGVTYIWSTDRVAYYGYTTSGNTSTVTLSEISYSDRQITSYSKNGYYYASVPAS